MALISVNDYEYVWPCVRLLRLQPEAPMVRFRCRSSSCQRRWECLPLVLVVRAQPFSPVIHSA